MRDLLIQAMAVVILYVYSGVSHSQDIAPLGFRFKNAVNKATSSSNVNDVTYGAECSFSDISPSEVKPLTMSAYGGIWESVQFARCRYTSTTYQNKPSDMASKFNVFASSYCPVGFNPIRLEGSSSRVCRQVSSCDHQVTAGGCQKTKKSVGPTNSCGSSSVAANSSVGNPINIANGLKWEVATDFKLNKLLFKRTYNSFPSSERDGKIGKNWTHSFNRGLIIENDFSVVVLRPEGEEHKFYLQNLVINSSGTTVDFVEPRWITEEDVFSRLERLENENQVPTGWKYTTPENKIEYYDAEGLLVRIEYLDGAFENYLYEDGLLISVVSSYGDSLSILYNTAQNISRLVGNGSVQVEYLYDASGNLEKVVKGDGAYIQYHYENYQYPHALTGLSDERGYRYAVWGYDGQGRAINSSHHDNADLTQIDYISDNLVSVINPLGRVTDYEFENILGVNRLVQVDGAQSDNCASSHKSYSYYLEGNESAGLLKSKTDWEGNTTAFEYNDRGLETKKTEAQGTPDQKITLTEWHPTFNLPTKITEGSTQTEMTYDSEGKLISQTQSQVLAQ